MAARSAPGSERRTAIMLIVVSALFVIAGTAIWVAGGDPMGLLAMLFFGGCLIAGVMMLVGPYTRAGQILAILGALGMGAGCASLAIMAMAGVPLGWRGHPAVAIPIGLIGAIFFGGGGILLLVRAIRRSRRNRRP
ncbi:MAG TPA: hypothetical protein IAA98_16150 [Candidatus Avipropionibacterium avicola]|uniref:Uncharacterized protein n=1 Tax=Candidatus Avipropionibacterium avicola TaxID=2840701 RepID=A0A9D1H0B9_9ACTN|nr:hypothetical protein [Candidatus Avipropionibacterium avicola]